MTCFLTLFMIQLRRCILQLKTDIVIYKVNLYEVREMFINSDWHIHSEASYDGTLSLEELVEKAKLYKFKKIGITDHVNYNDSEFLADLRQSAEDVNKMQKTYPDIVLGAELTPIEKPLFDYIAKTGTREGYVPPMSSKPYDMELAVTKEEMVALGVRYAIGASHWRVDVPNAQTLALDIDATIREWYRQQMWLACDERVTILGHPWFNGDAAWYEDFSVIPRSMNMDIAAALKENKKYVEYNRCMLLSPQCSEKFRIQYAEFMRELFEMGIPMTFGSDAHGVYSGSHLEMEKYLTSVGFKEGDFTEIAEKDLW